MKYQAMREVTIQGRHYLAGDTVDTAGIHPVRLARLMEWRRVMIVPDAGEPVPGSILNHLPAVEIVRLTQAGSLPLGAGPQPPRVEVLQSGSPALALAGGGTTKRRGPRYAKRATK